MPTTVLALLATDLKKKINPTDMPAGFLGSESDITAADVDDTLQTAEEEVLNVLKERYRGLMRHCDGERIVRHATAGQTTATLSLSPASNVRLYKNWDERRPWNPDAVHLAMAPSEFSVSASTGAVTLTSALAEGDTLIAVYDHAAGSRLRSLREVALIFAASNWAMSLDSVSVQAKELWKEERKRAYATLRSMNEGAGGGLDVFNAIDLARETRVSKDKPGSFAPLGAW